MSSLQDRASPPRHLGRIAVLGMSLAVLALGALAIWAAIVTQNHADGLSKAGVQTSGHLRAVQALSLLDTSSDALEEELVPRERKKLRQAQGVLDDAFRRMKDGSVRPARRIAVQAEPGVAQLRLAVEAFLLRPPGDGPSASPEAEEELEEAVTGLQVLLNDLDADPSKLLEEKLDAATESESAVRAVAFVLIPLGLGSVAACAWLLSVYRRRSEAVMRSAIDTTAHDARTDELTGLPNRRALLEELYARTAEGEPFTLTLADLNGFKRYNDTFGHPAGDALLRRLGQKLAAACEGRALAARLGGDEFCVLFYGDGGGEEPRRLVSVALSETGEGFEITAASGQVAVPAQAVEPEAALRIADARMYAAKFSGRPSAEDAMSRVMTRMLDEHHPGLGTHVAEVAELAAACAVALGLRGDEVQAVKRAAELHDVGKVAIPAAILTKKNGLNEEEWDFVRRHPVIGERILAGVTSLEDVASLVRSSHERWDGNGYPDGLEGEAIPIGARIVFVADAFCAMTERRPYGEARTVDATCRELRACAGTQFDPDVVAVFLSVMDRREVPEGDRVPQPSG